MTSALKQTQTVSKQTQIDQLRVQMAAFRLEFIEATKEYVTDWYDNISDNFYSIKKEITAQMSTEQKFDFKDQIIKLKSESNAKIDSLLSDESLWWDLNTDSSTDNNRYKSIEDFMPERFKYILGKLAPVLVQYGYVERSKFGDQNFIAEQDGSGSYTFKFDGLYFPSDEMKRSFDKYWEWFKFAIRI